MVALSAGAEDAVDASADDLQLAEAGHRTSHRRGSNSGRHGSVGARRTHGRHRRSIEDQDADEDGHRRHHGSSRGSHGGRSQSGGRKHGHGK